MKLIGKHINYWCGGKAAVLWGTFQYVQCSGKSPKRGYLLAGV